MVCRWHCNLSDLCYRVSVPRDCICPEVRYCPPEIHMSRVRRVLLWPTARCKGPLQHPGWQQDKRRTRICRLEDNCRSVIRERKFPSQTRFLRRASALSENREDRRISRRFAEQLLRSCHDRPNHECNIQPPWKRIKQLSMNVTTYHPGHCKMYILTNCYPSPDNLQPYKSDRTSVEEDPAWIWIQRCPPCPQELPAKCLRKNNIFIRFWLWMINRNNNYCSFGSNNMLGIYHSWVLNIS